MLFEITPNRKHSFRPSHTESRKRTAMRCDCKIGSQAPMWSHYRPQRSWAKVIFSQACVCPQGGLPQCMLGYTHPRSRPPRDQNPLRADTPREQTPLGADTPGSRHPQSRHPPGADPPGSRPPGSRPPWEQTPPGADPSDVYERWVQSQGMRRWCAGTYVGCIIVVQFQHCTNSIFNKTFVFSKKFFKRNYTS